MKSYDKPIFQIWRNNKRGYKEIIWFTGNLKEIPKGWKPVLIK